MLLLALLSVVGCRPDASTAPDGAAPPLQLTAGESCLVYAGDGRVDLLWADGREIARGLTAGVTLDQTGEGGRALRLDDGGEHSAYTEPFTDALGSGERLVITRAGSGDEPALTWVLSAYPETGALTARLEAAAADEAVAVAAVRALELEAGDGGGLFLGPDPATHRILENGTYGTLDYLVQVLPGDVEQNGGYALVAPGDFQGASVSSWNHAVLDLDSGATWIAGALTFDDSLPVLSLSYRALDAQLSDDGRAGFTYLAAEAAMLPHPAALSPGREPAERALVRPPHRARRPQGAGALRRGDLAVVRAPALAPPRARPPGAQRLELLERLRQHRRLRDRHRRGPHPGEHGRHGRPAEALGHRLVPGR